MSESRREPPPSFTMRNAGRSGAIVYEAQGRSLRVSWEVSGSAEYHLLLAPLDLRHWTTPDREALDLSQQLEILAGLRDWLASMKIRTDIERPPEAACSAERCGWAGCGNPRLLGLAFCALHFDLSLLAG